jgi:HAD superfamily hydrolase (TIGR01549 family)
MNDRYKALIFDLDDTLFDTWGTCYPAAAKESCEIMVREGLNCSGDQCIRERENFFRTMPRRDVFQHIVERFGVRSGGKSADEIASLGKKAFHSRQVEKDIKLFPGARELLAELKIKYMTFLVTSGDPATQKQKVNLLRIKDFFTHIYYVNVLLKQRKSQAFMEILEHTSMEPRSILCIGDRRDREIAEGKRLGFMTCLLKREHQMCIRPDLPEENPDFEIERLGELIPTCRL